MFAWRSGAHQTAKWYSRHRVCTCGDLSTSTATTRYTQFIGTYPKNNPERVRRWFGGISMDIPKAFNFAQVGNIQFQHKAGNWSPRHANLKVVFHDAHTTSCRRYERDFYVGSLENHVGEPDATYARAVRAFNNDHSVGFISRTAQRFLSSLVPGPVSGINVRLNSSSLFK